jgi:hypothetical protein
MRALKVNARIGRLLHGDGLFASQGMGIVNVMRWQRVCITVQKMDACVSRYVEESGVFYHIIPDLRYSPS